jgi:hypothetical protein
VVFVILSLSKNSTGVALCSSSFLFVLIQKETKDQDKPDGSAGFVVPAHMWGWGFGFVDCI